MSLPARPVPAAAPGDASREGLAKLSALLTDAIIGTDALSTITLWNAGAERLLGWTTTDVLGKNLDIIIPPGMRKAHAEGRDRLLSGGAARVLGRSVVLPALHARGHLVQIQLAVSQVQGFGDTCFLAVLRNTMEIAEAEAARLLAAEREVLDAQAVQAALAQDASRERARADALDLLSNFQTMAAAHSRAFITAGEADFDGLMQDALADLGRHSRSDRAYVFAVRGDRVSKVQEWCAPGVDAMMGELQDLPMQPYELFLRPLRAGAHLYLPSAEALPADDPTRSLLLSQGINHLLAMPVFSDGALTGFVGVDNPRLDLDGPVNLIASIRLVTDVIGAAIERRRRNAALTQERERLAVVMNSASATLYSVSLPGFQVEHVSDSIVDNLGFTAEEARAPGFWEQHIHPEDRARVLAGLGALYQTGRLVHEYRHAHRAGGYRWIHDDVRVIYDAGGTPVRAVGASFDITERRRNELRIERLVGMQGVVSRVSERLLRARAPRTGAVLTWSLRELARFTGASAAWLLARREPGEPSTRAWRWPPHPAGAGPAPETLLAALDDILGGKNEILLHRANDPAWTARLEALTGAQTARLVPLDRHHGHLLLQDPRDEDLSADELLPFLRLFADTLEAGLRRLDDEGVLHSLHAESEVRLAERQQLLDLATALARAEGLQAVWDALSTFLPRLLPYQRVSLLSRDDAAGVWQIRLLVHADALPAEPRWVRPGSTMASMIPDEPGSSLHRALTTGQVLSTREHVIDTFWDWAYLRKAQGVRQFVVHPMPDRGTFRGTLNFSTGRDEPPTDGELALIAEIGTLTASHLAIWEARTLLTRLNADLEARVATRTHALAASEARFQLLFNAAPQAMLLVGVDGRIASANTAASLLFRAARTDDLLGRPVKMLLPGDLCGAPPPASPAESARERVLPGVRLDGARFAAEVGIVRTEHNGEPAVIIGISDVTLRVEAVEALKRSLTEKDMLLQEVHHRVKNNLQIVSGLLQMQLARVDNPAVAEQLRESVVRIQSMAFVHQSLYQAHSLDRVDLAAYLRRLVSAVRSGFAPSVRVSYEVEDVAVSVDVAVPLGLAVTELLTNAFKYGVRRPEPAPCGARTGDADLVVTLRGPTENLEIAVIDSGPGLAMDARWDNSLGLRLVRSLAEQIHARVEYDHAGGSRFAIIRRAGPVSAEGAAQPR